MNNDFDHFIPDILEELKSLRNEVEGLRNDIVKISPTSNDSSNYDLEVLIKRLTKLFYLAFSEQILSNVAKTPSFERFIPIIQDKLNKISQVYNDSPQVLERLDRLKRGSSISFRNPSTGEKLHVGMQGLIQYCIESCLLKEELNTRPFGEIIEILLTGIAMGEDEDNYEKYFQQHSNWAEESQLD